jgi:hypothetical protein
MKKPKCFYGDKEKCLGYSSHSAYNDDEPIERCKNCEYCESYQEEKDSKKEE